ncbi:unnamed protein product [Diatraea saccharalis]|uniref:ZAD domain-containing protein n=1 Tax=Diatraea saccharalis TaxID=40085 RepID=A0A9N9R405_9NEOP|nr:unnamed protein product [Diatraea saccharalis]
MESSSKSDINTYFGRCRCCLEQGYMKNLWSEYYYEGSCEIYGEMIMETFTITWEPEEDMKYYICESCVIRLRDAYYFKKEVVASEKLLSEGFDGKYYESNF